MDIQEKKLFLYKDIPAKELFEKKYVGDTVVSCSESRITIGGRKLGSSLMHRIQRENPDIVHTITKSFFSSVKSYLTSKTLPESKDLIDIVKSFDPDNQRQVVFFIRDPFAKLLSAMTTVIGLEFATFKSIVTHDTELHYELEELSGNSPNKILQNMSENAFKSLLRYSIKYAPHIFTEDQHVFNDHYINLLNFLLFLRLKYPNIFNRTIILDLDNYSTEPQSLQYLRSMEILLKDTNEIKVNSFANFRTLVADVMFKDINCNTSMYELSVKNEYLVYDTIYEHFSPIFYSSKHYLSKSL